MPNKKRSGASRRTKAGSPQPENGFQASPAFSFSFPQPTTSAPAASTSSAPKKGKRFAPPVSSSEESDSEGTDSEEESEDERSQQYQEADEVEMPPYVKPDDELTPEERIARAEEKKEDGNKLFKTKDYPSATRLYSQAIALAPTNAAYLTNRAASLMASRLYSSALADCVAASALQLAAPQTKTLLRLAKCQLALGLVLAAHQTLDHLLRLDPANPAVVSERGRAARIDNHVSNVMRERERKNWSMVLLGIDAAAKEVEETPREWRTWKVEALIGKKRYDDAIGQATDLLRANPKQPEALYYRGLCMYYSGNHPQAINHCMEALRNDPDFILARTLLRKVKQLDLLREAGNEAFKGSRMQEAIDKYSEGLAIDKENDSIQATLLSNRATAYMRLKQSAEAFADCDACLAIDPKYFKAFRTRGRLHLAAENFEDSLRDLKQAYELAATGSNDEASLQREVKDVEVKLKKSKMKDHYKTLGITVDASEVEIKKGYRSMSLIHHPDKGGSDDKFKEVGEAYAILSDPVRRRKFDSGIDESDPMSGMGSDFGDMGGFPSGGFNMEDMFGGGGGGGYGGGFSHGHGGRRQQNPFGY